jgi:hypothetical protein
MSLNAALYYFLLLFLVNVTLTNVLSGPARPTGKVKRNSDIIVVTGWEDEPAPPLQGSQIRPSMLPSQPVITFSLELRFRCLAALCSIPSP